MSKIKDQTMSSKVSWESTIGLLDSVKVDEVGVKERVSSFIAALPALITPVIILGGIYAGILTPSESAAVAGVYAVLIGFLIYRELTFSSLIVNINSSSPPSKLSRTSPSLSLLEL